MSILQYGPDGSQATIESAAFYARLGGACGGLSLPFSAERIGVVSRVSDAILKGRQSHRNPSVVHFAFWTRRNALQRLADSFRRRIPAGAYARPRGLVFHLPPQNVETVFLYSWVLSYLSGNANIVRLPAEVSAEMRAICDLFLREIEQAGDRFQFFVHYASQTDIGKNISCLSDCRIVWGGDAKVNLFAGVPLRKGGKALWFGDRFSFALLNGDTLLGSGESERRQLATKLFNDIFVFEQMACASPHILYVVGSDERHGAAVADLLLELATVAKQNNAAPATGHVIKKMVEAFTSAGSGDASRVVWDAHELTSVITTEPDRLEQRVGGGYLRVSYLGSPKEVLPLLREHDQTVTYFGFDVKEIEALIENTLTAGATRWTPVGTALDFDSIWDGYDIPFELTKLVKVT